MSFCTAVNCMDGRVQLPVIDFLQKRFDALYVDVVSEPGPAGILGELADFQARDSILKRIDISINAHKSKGIAVVAHHDCAGNPVSEQKQCEQLYKAIAFLSERYPNMEVIGLWLNEEWIVSELVPSK